MNKIALELKKSLKYSINNRDFSSNSKDDVEKGKENVSNDNNDQKIVKTTLFLDNDLLTPEKSIESNEDDIISVLKSESVIKTITNIAEILFTLEKNKDTGFWLKCGLINNANISRHLIITSLVYSQLGQTMIAEGMYRQCLNIIKDNPSLENNCNLSFCLNMYGRLLLRDLKRKEEGEKMIVESEKIQYYDWYKTLTKMYYFNFDFE